jgi:hypothetical protein
MNEKNPPVDYYLNLPDGRGVDLPPPVLPLEAYWDWLEEMHQDRVTRGVLMKLSEDPSRMPVDARFTL